MREILVCVSLFSPSFFWLKHSVTMLCLLEIMKGGGILPVLDRALLLH